MTPVLNCNKLNICIGFGVINLLEGCTLSADDYMYPHTFTGFSDIDLAIEVGLELEVCWIHGFWDLTKCTRIRLWTIN